MQTEWHCQVKHGNVFVIAGDVSSSPQHDAPDRWWLDLGAKSACNKDQRDACYALWRRISSDAIRVSLLGDEDKLAEFGRLLSARIAASKKY